MKFNKNKVLGYLAIIAGVTISVSIIVTKIFAKAEWNETTMTNRRARNYAEYLIRESGMAWEKLTVERIAEEPEEGYIELYVKTVDDEIYLGILGLCDLHVYQKLGKI